MALIFAMIKILPMIDQKYIDIILDRVDIEDVVSCYVGGDLKRQGHRLWACCPFHNENTPSFCVDTIKNTWHCFGSCGEGGNVISFVMKAESLPFPLAVKKILKDYLHIEIKESDFVSTHEDELTQKKKESMFIINDQLCKYFFTRIHEETPSAKAALCYVNNRWGEEYCKEMNIGYAPDDWQDTVTWAEKKSLSLEIMVDMGVLRSSEKTKNLYSFYRNRVMIPIRDRYSHIIGFTARTLDEHDDRKYLNSSNSLIYSKDYSIFGIDTAARKARIEEKFYLVEGGPDVMRLQSVGILNTVAALGGAWTQHQLDILSKYNATLCFIPDSDEKKHGENLGAGDKNVIKNGSLAMRSGFTVSVRELPNDTGKKIDPDEYIKDVNIFNGMIEEEFIIWFARKQYDEESTTEERLHVVNKVCDLLVCIKNEDVQSSYITKLTAQYGHKYEWINGLKAAKRRKLEQESKGNKKGDIDMLRQFGFIEKHHGYYGTNKDGGETQWSNFTLKPLFHIKDDIRPVRLFEINNDDPEDPKEIIELDMEVFTSAKLLRKKLLGIGNYTWLVNDDPLIQLQRYLAKVTETAVEIKQLGWQKAGFYCFCNGAQENGIWTPVDSMGIVRLKSGKFYLPAMSKIYENSTELYVNERKFRHMEYCNIPAKDYFSKIIEVFGDNAKISILFYIATLFRDIIKAKIRFFPILNIFGPKGSGKTELAETMMSFFSNDNEPQNIETASIAALADAVASFSNSLVHLDEYKNSIDIKKIEWLKDLWGGIGRSRMNMDKDKKREQSHVDSGVIITGQEMPTADIALFSRLIYMTYDKQHHSQEERENFSKLMHFRMMGATHITLDILKHRDKFEASFGGAWKRAEIDVEDQLKGTEIMDRIERNWLVPLSAYLSFRDIIDFPFDYENLLNLCVEGIKRQNMMCTTTDEVAGFWNIISSAQQKGIFIKNQDYKIKARYSIKTSKLEKPIKFDLPKKILMIRKNSMLATYRQFGRQMDERLLPSESILHYLMISPESYGYSSNPERFKKFSNTGIEEKEEMTDQYGKTIGWKTIWHQDRPLCFDYEKISSKFGIILETMSDEINDYQDTHVPESNIEEQKIKFNQDEGDVPF